MIVPSAEQQRQLVKVREYLCRLAKSVTHAVDPDKPYAFQTVRRARNNGDIEYQIFADTEDGTQIAWVQSTRHDAEFIAACLAQAPLFEQLMQSSTLLDTLSQEVERLTKENAEFLTRAGSSVTLPPERATAPTDLADLVRHLERQSAFSEKTFGPGVRTAGVVDHIRKELREIEAKPHDLSEWIDVVILAFDGAWRAGYSPIEIVAALVAKQTKNEARRWPDWRSAPPDKAIEHVRGDKEGVA